MDRKIEFNKKNIFFYFFGFFILGLGVTSAIISNFGAGPWDTVTKNLSELLVRFTLGTTSILIASILMVIVLGYTRKWKLIFMIVPIFLVGVSLDFWDILIFGDYLPNTIILRILFYILGVITIPLGLAFIIASKFPAFVFDELMIMLMTIFKTKRIVAIRVGIEITGIILGTIFGFLAGVGFGAVGVGSVLMAIVLGPILAFFLKILTEKEMEKTRLFIKNTLIYLLGTIFIAFSVVMMIKSTVGVSSWDTLHYSIHKLTGVTVGEATIIVATVFAIMVIIGNKNIKYLFMAIPIVIVGTLIDVFNLYVFVNYIPETYVLKVSTYLLGLILLPFGGALLILSSFPAGVFDEFMLTMMRVFKTNKLVLIRVIMEMSAVALAIFLGYLAGIGFGMVNIGTLIFSLTVGMFIRTYLRLFEKANVAGWKSIIPFLNIWEQFKIAGMNPLFILLFLATINILTINAHGIEEIPSFD